MSILDEIVAHKAEEIKHLPKGLKLKKCCTKRVEIFADKPALIAEVKAKSPSEGVIAKTFDPVSQAQAYVAGGSAAISVLTDEKYFGGSFDILKKIRAMTDTPLLCKEFVIDSVQVEMARACGADMVLLIVKILDDATLLSLKSYIEDLGMLAVIEVQNQQELDRALKINPEILLINNRNLTSFDVDMDTTARLLENIPQEVTVIAASGIQYPSEIKDFSTRVDGFLIGTSLMRSKDPEAFLKACHDTQS